MTTASLDSANSILDAIIEHGAQAGVVVAEELRRKVVSLMRRRASPAEIMDRVRRTLALHEPLFLRSLSDTLLASWLAGATEIERDSHYHLQALGPPPDLPDEPIADSGEGEPLVRFPAIEAAARDLLERRVMPRAEFDSLANDAKRAAFTVAHVGSLDALERIQQALAEGLQEGDTLKGFSERVGEALDGSSLSPSHIETIYRNNTSRAYTDGLMDVLNNTCVGDEFPYLAYYAIHDPPRVRPEHLAMEKLGLDGTNIYRRDDPIWEEFLPPWDYG